MKVLIIVTVLAVATSAIAVPLSRQAKAQALLATMQDNAEMEGFKQMFGMIKKHGPAGLDLVNDIVNGGGEENENEDAQAQSRLENLKLNALKKSVMRGMTKAEVEGVGDIVSSLLQLIQLLPLLGLVWLVSSRHSRGGVITAMLVN